MPFDIFVKCENSATVQKIREFWFPQQASKYFPPHENAKTKRQDNQSQLASEKQVSDLELLPVQ